MKRNFSILFSLLLILSCSHKLKMGSYKFENDSEIIFTKNNHYEFRSLNQARPFKFSKGSYKIKNNEMLFLPDSNYLPHIKVKDAYFDSSIIGKIRVILEDNNIHKSDDFLFYFFDNSDDALYFNNSTRTFEINKYNRDQIAIFARFNNSMDNILPGYYHKAIVSNVVSFSDVYIEFGKWNVVKLSIDINEEMFSFISLDAYLFKKGKVIRKDWPIYNFIK